MTNLRAGGWSFLGLCVAVLLLAGSSAHAETAPTFVNPVYGGQDPFIFQADGAYYMAATAPGEHSLVVFKSDSLTDRGVGRTVYTAPDAGPYSSELWAPEIHRIDGHWYIYTCADNGDNANHRLIVLKAKTDDPQGEYAQAAVLKTPAWAIDESVFRAADGQLYCVWSGWPVDTVPDSTQHIFISKMASPVELTGEPVDISGKMYDWETIGRPAGLNEGPQVFTHGGRTFLLYACSGSWTPDYCLGVMECVDGDLLNPDSWVKRPTPAFRRAGNVYGPGHGCVTKSPDGKEDWLVYHSSIDPQGSWNRSISIKRYGWNEDGTPDFGTPPDWGTALPAPSGDPLPEPGGPLQEDFTNLDRWEEIAFYRRDTVRVARGVLRVRGTRDPRYHDKVVLRDRVYDDFELSVDINRLRGDGAAGVVFRAHDCAVGENRYKGYALLLHADGELQLGKSDGEQFTPLAKHSADSADDTWRHARIVAHGDRLEVYLDNASSPVLTASDAQYAKGRVGLMAAGADVEFRGFEIAPLED